MEKFKTLLKYEIREIVLSRWFLCYIAAFNVMVYTLLYFSNQIDQVFTSTLNVLLYFHFITVLALAVLTWQNSMDFVSLVLSQPVSRRDVFWARLTAFTLSVSLLTGISLVVQLGATVGGAMLLKLLTAQFAIQAVALGLGFLIAIGIEDRLKAIATVGVTVGLLCFALDAFALGIMIQFSAFPLEKTILTLNLLNPLSLLKYQSLIEQNNSLWIGYAGVLLTRTWQTGFLQMMSALALSFWLIVPVTLSFWLFKNKDL